MTPVQFQKEHKSNYINVIKNIKSKIKSYDIILLCTLHPVHELYATYSYSLNNNIREISKELNLKLFDFENITRSHPHLTPKRSEFLSEDCVHQSTQQNSKYVNILMKYLNDMDINMNYNNSIRNNQSI